MLEVLDVCSPTGVEDINKFFFVGFELSAAATTTIITIIIVLKTSLLGRLTEDPDNQVLLLEAGPKYEQNQFSIWW